MLINLPTGLISAALNNEAGGVVDNYGTISGAVDNAAGAEIYNEQVTNVDGDVIGATISGDITNAGYISNAGIIKGEGKTVTNSGDIDNLEGGLIADTLINDVGGDVDNYGEISGDITNKKTGVITNENGGVISGNVTNNFGGSITNKAGGTITHLDGDGNPDKTVTNYGDIDNFGTIGDIVVNKPTGTITNEAGGVISGDVENQYGGNISNLANALISGDVANYGNIDNSGEISGDIFNKNNAVVTNNDGGLISGDVTNASGGLIDNEQGGLISGDVTNYGNVDNDGTISGDVTNGNGGVVANNANALISGDVANKAGGVVNNEGEIRGHVTNDAADASGTPVAGVVNSIASGLTGGVTNNGELNLNDGDGTQGTLGSDINGDGDAYITDGTVTIAAGTNVVQDTLNTNAGTVADINGTVTVDDLNNNGTTNINDGSAVTADNINNNAGTTNINETVKADNINSTGGTVNVNAYDGETRTSDLLKDKAGTGASDIYTGDSTTGTGTVAINTDSDNMTVDNNVTGDGTLALNGNAPALDPTEDPADPSTKTDSNNVGTVFDIDPNVTVASAVDLQAGQLDYNGGSNITGPITVRDDATLNVADGEYSTIDGTTFDDGSYLKADVNVFKDTNDTFTNATENGNEYITDLDIYDIEKLVQNSKHINLTDALGLDNVNATEALKANLEAKYTSVLTPIRKMNARVSVTDDGLMLNIIGTGNEYKDFNPAVMASPVAAQLGGYLVQLSTYEQAFNNMDMYMLMTSKQRQALKMRNKIAATAGTQVAYDPTTTQNDYTNMWFKPYASFEKVGLAGGPKVENNSWGTFIGGESEMKDLGNGWDGMWGAYVGYNGAHQNYDGVGIYENGGTFGLVGMAYKDNFFAGATVNAGIMAADASTMYGSEEFNMLTAGIAAKTGYNWELADGKFIIQPSLQTSYSFVNTFDYHNAAGVFVDAEPLHAITIEPGIKLIGNLNNGWQPYAGLSGVFTIMDRTHFRASDVSLPMLSVSPYAKYGIGVRKTWGERFSGFFQGFIMSGGRNGIGLQGGFKWALGADGTGHITSKDASTPELKKTTVNLQNKKASVK